MTAFVATYPPAGQVTQLQSPSVVFHAVLEVPCELAAEPWQVALWHSAGQEGEWSETEFMPGSADLRPAELHEPKDGTARLFFTLRLTVRSALSFTVKFRSGPDHVWRWIRDDLGVDDGIVVVNENPTRESGPEDLPDLIRDFNPDLKWKKRMSQSPGTRLWSVQAGVDGAKDDESAFAEIPLGVPWGRFLRWFALVRTWTPWLAPRHGRSSFELDKDALLCSFLSAQGKHLVFLGMSGVDNVMTLFRSSGSERLTLHIRNDNADAAEGTVLVAVGDNFESALAAVVYHARALVQAANAAFDEAVAETTAQGGIRPQWYENWYDGLGYCTWNSLGQQLTAEKILRALDALAENDITVSSIIIDDNWQDVDDSGNHQWQCGWKDFEADPKAFPGGLKKLTSEIRSKHKNIHHIAVWHALLGYWGGLAPEGPLAKSYKTVEVVRGGSEDGSLPVGGKMTVVATEDTRRFYDDFYRFLSSSGVDGVKTDAQFMVDTWVSASTRRDLTNSYLDAWTLASLRHLSGKAISCMSQAPSILFHSQLPRGRPAVVCRNSDDFFPDVPAAHPWHVWANAHNALLTRHLNVLPDWDMFQSAHPYAAFHAAARCVAASPVCLTDVPGQHDPALVRQIAGLTPRGTSAVFRPAVVGRALDVYVGYHDRVLLKVGAYHGRAREGTGIVGLFNVSGRPLTELVPLARFPGVVASSSSSSHHSSSCSQATAPSSLQPGGKNLYVVRSHVTGRVTPPLEAGAPGSVLTVSLGERGYDVLCAFPLAAAASRSRGGDVLLANLGLLGKMTGCAAVLRTVFEVRENGRVLVDATVKALGVLGIFISSLPELSIQDDFMITIQGEPIPVHTVSVDEGDEHVLNVDIETAWKEMGLQSGWSNEVQVKIYFPLER